MRCKDLFKAPNLSEFYAVKWEGFLKSELNVKVAHCSLLRNILLSKQRLFRRAGESRGSEGSEAVRENNGVGTGELLKGKRRGKRAEGTLAGGQWVQFDGQFRGGREVHTEQRRRNGLKQ